MNDLSHVLLDGPIRRHVGDHHHWQVVRVRTEVVQNSVLRGGHVHVQHLTTHLLSHLCVQTQNDMKRPPLRQNSINKKLRHAQVSTAAMTFQHIRKAACTLLLNAVQIYNISSTQQTLAILSFAVCILILQVHAQGICVNHSSLSCFLPAVSIVFGTIWCVSAN